MSYARDHLIPLIDEGPGNSAYLADLGDGRTHGAGSFCSAASGAARVATIGAEKAANPLLAAPDEDAFARRLLASLGSYPAYFARLGEVNVELGDLPARVQDAPAGAVVLCGHGERAMTAASILQRAGHHGLAVLAGGAGDWADATGQPLREGP